jgi:hypothetical protein
VRSEGRGRKEERARNRLFSPLRSDWEAPNNCLVDRLPRGRSSLDKLQRSKRLQRMSASAAERTAMKGRKRLFHALSLQERRYRFLLMLTTKNERSAEDPLGSSGKCRRMGNPRQCRGNFVKKEGQYRKQS